MRVAAAQAEALSTSMPAAGERSGEPKSTNETLRGPQREAAQPRSLRRLMVIHYPFFGGPHNQALRLRAPLEARGVETTVVLPDQPGNAAARLRSEGIDVLEIRLRRLRATRSLGVHADFLWGFAGDVRRLRRVIRDTGASVVEINGLANPHAAVAARMEGVPIVWQLLDTPPMLLRRAMMVFVRRLADAVMSTGIEVARVHPGCLDLGDRVVPFFPPVDLAEFRPDVTRIASARQELGVRADAPVVGTLANITPLKGLEYFLGAAQLIRSEIPEAQFVILGRPMESQPEYSARILEAAEGLALVVDPADRVSDLLPAFDVFAMTSRSEGIATTVLEAMACGIPVVTADVGGLREAVMDGETGFVVPAADPAAVARRVMALVRDERRRRAFGRAARTRAEALFDAEACAAAHFRAIEIAMRCQ